jgi:outer membrane receptor protein involved in Fe transport
MLWCTVAAVQAQVGGMRVEVVDDQGTPLAGATVTLSHQTGNVKTTSETTRADGVVLFPVLRPGAGYRVDVSFPGMSPVRHDQLRVRLNERQTVRVQMIEAITEQVRVVAERGVVDLDKTETSTKFSDEFIGDLPVLDRFYQNVLVMAPGVQDADGDGNPNVHGSRTRDFQALVGGVSNVDPLTGQWLSRVNPNSIEEMEVITAGAGVEFGRAQGGFANIIQKQGSNRHEGIVEFHWQTSKLDGDGANRVSGLGVPEFETIQPGFQFSGPLVRDHLWYRTSYEKRDREEPINALTDVALFTHDSETIDAMLTWQASPRNKIALQYRSDPSEQENFGVSSRIPVESAWDLGRDVDTYMLTWAAPYSPRLLVESLVSWQDVQLTLDPAEPGVRNNCVPNSHIGFHGKALCTNLATDQVSGSYNETNNDARQRFSFKSKATIYGGRFLGADHQLKVGFNVENERYFRRLRRSPSIVYEEVFPFGGIPFGIILADVDIPVDDRVRSTGTNWALFLEDQLKPTANLTVTLGVRLDREEINAAGKAPIDLEGELAAYEATQDSFWEENYGPGVPILTPGPWEEIFTGVESLFAFQTQIVELLCRDDPNNSCETLTEQAVSTQQNADTLSKRKSRGINVRNNNFSPFVSLAWDPFGDGKTAVKASAGRHYNNIPLLVPLQELEPVRTTVEYRANLDIFETAIFGGISPAITVRTVDENISTPYQDEFTLKVERELWAETSLGLTYINRQFKDQIQDTNRNVKTGDYGYCASLPAQALYPVNVFPVSLGSYGDGAIDDCGGETLFFGSSNQLGTDAVRIQLPDGIPDLYAVNPFWGGVFEISNLNEIDYEAFVLELARRQFRSWQMNASYTYSKAEGDGEDFLQELANDPSLRQSVFGYQSYDQRHVVKVNATTITPWGLRLGTAVTWQSGLPYSIIEEATSDDLLPHTTATIGPIPGARLRQLYPTGQRNDQRNKSYWNVDLKATKELRLGSSADLQLSAELFNAMNDDTYIIYNPFFETGQVVNGLNEATRRFGRRWQVGARLSF